MNTRSSARKQRLIRLTITFCATILFVFTQTVLANPVGGSVVNGSAGFATSGNTLTVTNTPGTIINWQGFSINSNEVTNFAQQSAASTVLNRVVGNDPSNILGTLQSNGRVFLVNPNGILFGAGAVVDVAGLVASTLNLSDADFKAGNNHFTEVPGAANISNAGNITAHDHGQIYLIAPDVENTGVITAPNGEILLAAGHSVDLVSTDDPNLRVNITAPAGDATNIGQLIASSGSLGLFGTVVSNSGVVNADSATMRGGKIVFKASQRAEAGGTISASGASGGNVDISAAHSLDPNAPGVVLQTGVIQAQGSAGAGGSVSMNADTILSAAAIDTDGAIAGGQISVRAANRALSTSSAQYTAASTQGQGGDILVSADVSNYSSGSYSATGMTGGNITMAGNEIKLAAAQLDARGTNGGGTIHVGGLMHGATGFAAQGIALGNATNVLVNSATTLKADALQSGNGGEVVLWSDQAMSFTGGISAKGGELSGNGGNAEVSGLTSFGYGGLTDLSAASGLNGTLLLDPNNITIVAGSGLPFQEILDPTPGAGEGFGGATNMDLSNGNIVIASPLDSAFGTSSGAVYLYSPTGSLVSALVGLTAGDQVGSGGISTLTGSNSNNFVVSSPNWSNGGVATAGAVTWVNGSSGTTGAVSAANSLVGSAAGDSVGSYGSITVLSNGNYVVNTPFWTDLSGVSQVGAVTWGNGSTGTAGTIAVTNSLVGSKANDHVGIGGITALGNGNYVVSSYSWNGGLGAVTWGNGLGGTVGAVTSANSLVGNIATDSIGNGGVTALSNGNYVVSSYSWNGGFGAVTWGNGLGGTVGQVTSSNSLVGSLSTDQIGLYGGIISLANGNYLVQSSAWNNSAGAVTFGKGSTGVIGAVSASNSLIGSSSGDQVGSSVTLLTGGIDYVVSSSSWNGGFGAVTWGNGSTGTVGAVSSSNSLVGNAANSNVGNGGVTILANGNYVVDSYSWNGGLGAVTWANGSGGTVGAVTTANSLVGSTAGDNVGNGGITALGNGNYVVNSYYWNNGPATQAGAVTWVNGKYGYIAGTASTGGVVSVSNSLVGTTANDWVGINGITPLLVNGNYVVSSSYWSGGIGAVTWGNGSGGTVGAVTASKSLVGSTAGDSVGSDGVIALTNGNYVVSSSSWNGGYGAVTWGNGSVGTAGVVSAANSLVGSTVFDHVGSSGGIGNHIIELEGNGNLVITNFSWGSPSGLLGTGLGAVTWMNGANGKLADGTSGGAISATNSLVGSTPGDVVGSSCDGCSGFTIALSTGNYAVISPSWTNVSLSAAGAATMGNGAVGTAGTISAANSLVGTAANEYLGNGAFELIGQPGKVLIASAAANNGAGGVYLLGGSAMLANGKLSFTDSLGVDSPTGAALIASTLNAGTNVILQAYNDITQLAGASINATGAGNLTLQAGNNVTLNDVINIKGKLDISANDPAAAQASATGVLDTSKAILTASQINLINYGSGDVSIGYLHGGSGAVTVAATGGNFINNSGSATPITTTGLVSIYSTAPAKDTLNGMGSNFHRYNCTYSTGCMTPGTTIPTSGTTFFYAYIPPPLTVTANSASKTYGIPDSSALTYGVTGYLPGDTAANAPMSGSLAHNGGENVGTGYAITQGTLANQMGYGITFSGSTLNITPTTLTVAANSTNKILTTADPPLTYRVSGLQWSDTAATTLNPVTISRSAGETVGNYPITVSTSLTAGLASTNYTLNLVGGNFIILAPGVINEIVDISNQKQKNKEDLLALNLPPGDRGNTQGLPMCN